MTRMIDKMLNEINRDYYESVRKSILDYVLKDDDERKRIGIMSTFNEVKDYGDNIYMGLEADDSWKEHVELAR
jgi:dynein heavy chain